MKLKQKNMASFAAYSERNVSLRKTNKESSNPQTVVCFMTLYVQHFGQLLLFLKVLGE